MCCFEKEKKITMGRHKSCLVKLPEKSFSSYHSVISFNEDNNKWIIYDGSGPGTSSTNGTW